MNTQDLLKVLQEKYPKKEFYLSPFSDLCIDGTYTDEELKAMNLPDQFITFEHQGVGVWDPFSSECSRFIVEPYKNYRIKKEDANMIVEHNKVKMHG